MRRDSPFQLAAKTTLKITQREVKKDKTMLNTLKGGNDLHRQLTKAFNPKQKTQSFSHSHTQLNTTIIRQKQKNQQQAMAQDVAALDDFVAVVSKQKTRNLIENIKLRRRSKHLEAYEEFKEELDDYKENLNFVYNSLTNDLQQVLIIKENQTKQYMGSLSDEYLLTRNNQFLSQIRREVDEFKQSVETKLKYSFDEADRIRTDRQGLVEMRCRGLFEQLLDIAFVLEDEAKEISDKQKSEMEQLEEQIYKRTKQKLEQFSNKQKQLFNELENRSEQLQNQWKTVNEDKQIEKYLADSKSDQYRWPQARVELYKELIQIQTHNSERKGNLIKNLAKEHPDSFSKANIDKWNEHLKMINQSFGNQLDQIIKQLMDEVQESQQHNNQRYDELKSKLNYIEKKTPEEVETLLQEKCEPSLKRNIEDSKELLKQVTNYAEGADQKQNQAFQKVYQFMLQLGKRSDDFSKKWIAKNQQYELQKAKLLDNDDQIVQKLTNQLNDLKQQLKQSLHHIKLQEVQKACFDKIDELQQVYRKTHQNNKDIASTRPGKISAFMDQFEAKIAEAFSLFDQSKKNELLQMAKKECQEKATKQWQEQDRKKQEEDALALEETKKKGGKAPAAKPKDPKKAQAQMQERKKAIMQQIGLRTIQQVTTASGSAWLAYKSLLQIASQFYERQQNSGDALGDEIQNYKGQSLATRKALISAKEIASELQTLRSNFFQKLGEKKSRVLAEADQIDSVFIEESLGTLDHRLRQHYPLKGKLEAEIGVVRAGQITGHKKQYEKHVRIVKEKMDLQTQKFNYLLERCLQLFKDHNADQKQAKQKLTSCKTLADFQGCQRKSHQNFKYFSREMQEVGKELNRLSSVEVEAIIHSNDQFIKKSKLLSEGGEFSSSQLEWYKQMMTEINDQITQQKQKRTEKARQVQEQSQKRSKELIENFDKEYANYLEDLSAREGTGKKYGKPKRVAQEKIRLEMNKCEQAQINIDKQIDKISEVCQNGPAHFPEKPTFIEWRQQLMTLQTCIVRYAKHIEAIVPNCKARVMPRITRKEGISDALLTPEQEQEDKKKQQQELSYLGPLAEQKDDKIFIKFVEDIQKLIGDEARTIYSGDKAKYITGNDKLPDFLRNYIYNMKKNAQAFRQQSVRNLRDSCNRFSSMANAIADLFFSSLESYYGGSQASLSNAKKRQIDQLIREHSKLRDQHFHKLRPNLSHPDCQKDLKALDQQEQKRQSQLVENIKQKHLGFEDQLFNNASQFLYATLNNYEMLIMFFDSLYLQEDFAKVAGDDAEEKVHLDAKRLMLMKMKGITIDANSERNLKKKWPGVTCTIFNFGDKKFTNVLKAEEPPKQKDKKASKKDTKASKVQEAPSNPDESKSIQTFKTWRQKAVFTNRQQTIQHFSTEYQSYLGRINKLVEEGLKDNDSFKLKWAAIAKPLYIV